MLETIEAKLANFLYVKHCKFLHLLDAVQLAHSICTEFNIEELPIAEEDEFYESNKKWLEARKTIPVIGKDGLCMCNCGTFTGCDKTGMQTRCSEKQLISKGIAFNHVEDIVR